MVALERETDMERLRQAALLLEAENRRLTARLVELTRQLMNARGEEASVLQLRLAELERQLAQRNAELFGRSSEKRPRPSSEAAAEPAPQRGHGPRQQTLPTLEVVHPLDEADKQCPQCGGALEEMEGCFEQSEEVDVLERRFVLVKHKRQKYRCACNGCVETAPGTQKLQEGGRYSVDFAVEVATSKYLDHLPLERQVRIMEREGLQVDSQTLWDQTAALALKLTPTYEALLAQVRAQPVLGADETRWPLLGSAGQSKWHAWALSSPQALVYQIHEGRGEQEARQVVGDFAGVLMTDGLATYEALARTSGGRVKLAHCWAHVRRKFLESADARAQPALEFIAALYALEAEYKTGPPDPQRLHQMRQQKSRPVLERLQQWAYEVRALPESAFGRALGYMGSRWTGLTLFLEDARVPLDNNATERALRGPVVGRKNHYGSRSKLGTTVAALFYSLLESAKLVGAEPKAYLRAATRAALNGEPPLLPHQHVTRSVP